jgi:hypothetical protein
MHCDLGRLFSLFGQRGKTIAFLVEFIKFVIVLKFGIITNFMKG